MKKPIPRSPRTLAKKVSQKDESSVARFLKFWPVITAVFVGIGWLLTNTDTAATNAEKIWHWWRIDQAYTGVWSNDGEFSVDGVEWGAADGDKIKLAMTVEGRAVSGDIHGDRLCKFVPWEYVMFEGYTKWWGLGGIRARAFDHIGGRKTQFAEFDIHREWKSGRLVVEEISGSPIFPPRAMLLKFSEKEAQTVSEHGVPTHCAGVLTPPDGAKRAAPAASAVQPASAAAPASASLSGASAVNRRRPASELKWSWSPKRDP